MYLQNKSNNLYLASCRSLTKWEGSGSGAGSVSQMSRSADPDPYQNITGPKHNAATNPTLSHYLYSGKLNPSFRIASVHSPAGDVCNYEWNLYRICLSLYIYIIMSLRISNHQMVFSVFTWVGKCHWDLVWRKLEQVCAMYTLTLDNNRWIAHKDGENICTCMYVQS